MDLWNSNGDRRGWFDFHATTDGRLMRDYDNPDDCDERKELVNKILDCLDEETDDLHIQFNSLVGAVGAWIYTHTERDRILKALEDFFLTVEDILLSLRKRDTEEEEDE